MSTQHVTAATAAPAPLPTQNSGSCWNCREIVMLTGTLVAVTGLVLSVLGKNHIYTACFGILTGTTLIGLIIMIKYVRSEQVNQELQSDLTGIKATEGEMETDEQALKEDGSALKKDAQTFEAVKADLTRQLNEQKQLVTKLQEEIAALKITERQAAKDTAELSKAADSFATERNERAASDKIATDAASNCEAAMKRVAEVEQYNAQLAKEYTTALSQLKQLQTSLDDAAKKEEQILDLLDTERRNTTALTEQSSTLTNRVKELEQSLTAEQATVKNLQDQLKDLPEKTLKYAQERKRYEELRDQIDAKLAELKRVKEALAKKPADKPQ